MEGDEEILNEANINATELTVQENLELLKEVYGLIVQVLKKYCDFEERYYPIVALWIIGTWYHKEFHTYPYLFFNAMKGSGKTRIMKLLSHLCKNGQLLANMSEAVLFRTAENSTLLIDEFENVGKKEKNVLRELLNAAYKKGIKVKRAYKSKTMDKETHEFREEQKIEEFNVYCPIAMANISGMESVLADRCISLIIEKSDKPNITRKVEIFDSDPKILKIKSLLAKILNTNIINVGNIENNIYSIWNTYIDVDDVGIIYDVNEVGDVRFLEKIKRTNIDGRHLELFFPLFIIADRLGVLEEIIKFAEQSVADRQQQDLLENRDISLLDFIASKESTINFVPIKEMISEFRVFSDLQDEEDTNWLNARWLGRALRRLGLVIDQRNMGHAGRQVMINFAKAKVKIAMLKPIEKSQEVKNEEG